MKKIVSIFKNEADVYCSTFGADVKIGDLYEIKTGKFKQFDGEPKITEESAISSINIQHTSVLTCKDTLEFLLGKYTQKKCLKKLDFFMVNDDKRYYRFMLYIITKEEQCKSCKRKPKGKEFNYQVYGLHYGVYLEVIVLADNFPKNTEGMEELLKSAIKNVDKLNPKQKSQKCRVLINIDEEKEMTLEKLYEFIREIKDYGYYPNHITKIGAKIKKINNAKNIQIKNQEKFQNFLAYLYTCYRKIELKSNKSSLPNCDENTISESNLDIVKNHIQTIDKNDYLSLYPEAKKLFHCYCQYLENSIDKLEDINKGDNLPFTINEFKDILGKLNTVSEIEMNVEKENYQPTLVISNSDDQNKFIEDKFKFQFKIEKTDDKTEPYIADQTYQFKKYIGFIKILNTVSMNDYDSFLELEAICPQNCTNDSRQWYCIKCNERIKIKNFTVSCNCGNSDYYRQLMKCTNMNHNSKEFDLPAELNQLIIKARIFASRITVIEKKNEIDKKINFIIDKQDDSDINILKNLLNYDINNVLKDATNNDEITDTSQN